MEKARYIQIVLNCSSWQEAQRIADTLLEKHLIACAEFIEIKSSYWWKQSIEKSDEVKIIMQAIESKFREIETEVSNLHSYETFVLEALPILHISQDAIKWLETSIKSNELIE